jgi:hypothetical protein
MVKAQICKALPNILFNAYPRKSNACEKNMNRGSLLLYLEWKLGDLLL